MATSASAIRRVLIEVDADALDAVVGGWLRTHAICAEGGRQLALDGTDLHGGWNGDGRLVLFSALTHRRQGRMR